MSLASRLPYDHPYAGGYPGIGSQPLPTDADAIDYLTRMATADGAGVEVGVATAVDAFFRDLKATPGLFDAINASCILCGARTITGALVPLAGDAPTAQGAWASGDYSRTAGLTGDGNALYLDTNRASNADGRNDFHHSFYVSNSNSGNFYYMGQDTGGSAGATAVFRSGSALGYRNRSSGFDLIGTDSTGFIGQSRLSSAEYAVRSSGESATQIRSSQAPAAVDVAVFAGSVGFLTAMSDATIAFYSIGTSLSLEDLDTAVTNLITAIGEAL
jgi:hypothetical protein